MIGKDLEITIEATLRDAGKRRHEFLTVEHILFALIHDEQGMEVIGSCGGSLSRIKSSLEKYFEEHLPKLPEGNNANPQPTVAFHRVLQTALEHLQSSGKTEVDAGDILASILLEDDSHARYILESEGVSRLDVLNYLSHGITKIGEETIIEDGGTEEGGTQEVKEQAARDPLRLFTLNLIEKAASGELDPLVGRAIELSRIIQVLSRRRKNNVILVGEPGVGKTAMVEGLALKIFSGEPPDTLKGAQIFLLDMGGLLAGTKYRGEFENRLKATVKAIEAIPGAILFIDEIHTVVGAGATSGGSMDASNILKPVLNSGRLRCIGASTYEEYRNYFEKDRALSRRFQKIEIREPSLHETVNILKGLKSSYEDFHGVSYTGSALKAAAELSSKYINDKYLPDKAIDVIDEAGALLKLSPAYRKRSRVGPLEVERVVAKIARIPSQTISTSDLDKLKSLEGELKSVVFGQDGSIHSLVSSIKRARAGLGLPERPIGSFLFTGPTGVGKTEVSRQLASLLGVQFLRFDMSEYMEKHAVARLIGAPPGYVGFDQGGLLTDAVRKHPYSVLLLDEIEKAHPDLFSILLQVMDYATLTDNNGKTADFRNVTLIMTSNAGTSEMEKGVVGFGDRSGDTEDKSADAVKRLFTPEFRNRLDTIIQFNPLTGEVMLRVVDKFINELSGQLLQKKVSILFSGKARSWLAKRGYDPRFGARPLARVIQNEIKDHLSEEILYGRLAKGGKVSIGISREKLTFSFT